MTDQERQEGLRWAHKERRFDEKVRQPYLRFLRRLRGIPEPRITYDQAFEIASAYLDTTSVNYDRRPYPLIVQSGLRDYSVRFAILRKGGNHQLMVDMQDGHVHSFIFDSL